MPSSEVVLQRVIDLGEKGVEIVELLAAELSDALQTRDDGPQDAVQAGQELARWPVVRLRNVRRSLALGEADAEVADVEQP